MLGMAHLCEHLLFSSLFKLPFPTWMAHNRSDFPNSDKLEIRLPKTNYMEFVKSHAGSANAFTLASSTTYYFDIVQDKLGKALKLFSEPFSSPNLDQKFIATQIEIVDSEYKKNCDSDFQRLFQIFRGEALIGHPWRRFTTGNDESLGVKMSPRGNRVPHGNTPFEPFEPRDQENPEEIRCNRIEAWWEKKYDPRKMALAILGRESLDDLSKMAYDNFATIGNNVSAQVPPHNLPPFLIPWGSNPREITFIKRITDKPTLQVSFCLPDQDEVYRSKPAIYACYLISSEDPGGLCSYLKHKDLVTDLVCAHHQSARGFSFIRIRADLTKSGFRK
jgi:insulysin